MQTSLRTRRWWSPETAVYAALCAYVIGFIAFPPRVLLVVDESRYVSQALAFASGHTALPGARVILPPEPASVMSDYPPGTSLLQVPFVWFGGWPAAAWVSVLSLVVATLVTMRWLRDMGRSPGFALLIPAYFGSLFFGRVAMSDMPSCAIVSIAAWLLWRAERAGFVTMLLAGLASGASLLFREPNVVLLAPLAAGLVARRRTRSWPLLLGGVAGVALRLAASFALFGDPLYVRDAGYGFSLASIAHNAPQYAVILLVLFPLGLALPFLYRGERRAEIVSAFGLYLALFLAFGYDSAKQNGPVKGLILTTRYMLPALPLLVVMAADVFPRAYDRMGIGMRRLTAGLVAAVATATVLLAFAIHVIVRRQDAEPLAIVRAVMSGTQAAVPVITNHDATLKYFSPAYGARQLILRSGTSAEAVPGLMRDHGRLSLVFLDRTDSELFAKDAAANTAFLDGVRRRCELRDKADEQFGNSLRLRVFDVGPCP